MRQRVLQAIWDGKMGKEISADLGISIKTVDWHRWRLFAQYGVDNRISLCRRALRLGILKP
jgi:DNA-binding NarL/FixJ family response regulator